MATMLLLLAAAALGEPAGAAGPPAPVQHLKQVVVEAIRNCPKPRAGETVVCAKDRGIAEGYRLPKLDPRYAQVDAAKAGQPGALDGVGAAGTGACSVSGAGGFSGCAQQDYGRWAAERKQRRAAGDWFAW